MKTQTTYNGENKMKLSNAQKIVWEKILNHETLNPDEAYHYNVYSPAEDYTDYYGNGLSHTWYAKYVYGTFNTATLKALEKKGLIILHDIGGHYNNDTIEIITTQTI
jgi:hypothetical protein